MALLLLFIVLLFTSTTNSSVAASDITAFVYKTCSNNETLQNQPSNLRLDRLFITLVSQSSTTNFFKTTITNITGLYQCRGDLSHTQCNTCVQKLTNTIQTSCYTARAQLDGCYMWYEVDAYHVDLPSLNGLWHEECGVQAGTGTGFDTCKNWALKKLVDHVRVKKTGDYVKTSFECYYPVDVIGQCEGDLGHDDCASCVKAAVDFAQADCGSAFSADVYLHKCYISYSYGPDGNAGNTPGNACGLMTLMVATIIAFMLL